jgi:site-specific DNA recombinase
MRAAIYARVSTEDQAKEGFSIAAQVKRLNAYCKARGWAVAGEYIDEGHSGRSIERPAYKRMMAEIEKWDVLVVLKMDRIHRNSINFTLMMNALKDAGKEFNSMQESFDTTTAMGRFVMDIIQRIAQLESEQIGERVKVGMTQKAKKGKGLLGFPAPYGYIWNGHDLDVEPSEAEVVQRIYHEFLNCVTPSQIALNLNLEKIPTKHVASWDKSTIHGILANPIYIGFSLWNDIMQKGKHIPVVDKATFDQAQELMALKSRKAGQIDACGPMSVPPTLVNVP